MGVKALKTNFNYFLREIESKLGFETKLKWNLVFTLGFMHVFGAIWFYHYAFTAKWQTIVFAVYMYLASGMGITCGVHRLWTHKSYRATLALRIALMLLYVSNAQNSIYKWVRDHRVHHKFSDTAADPHNVNRGFWFSHIGWLMMEKNQLVVEQGRKIDMTDIESDPVAMFERKYHMPLILACVTTIPSLAIILWGESWQCAVAWLFFFRILAVFHAEMTVNSLAHIYGYKPYNKNMNSTQNPFVSVVTTGEGWHNYHHMFPSDYKGAETMDFMNLSTFLIRLWAKMGLAYDLKEASSGLVEAVKLNCR